MNKKFLSLLAAALLGGASLHAQCGTNLVDDPDGSLSSWRWSFFNNGDNGAQAINDNGDNCFVFSSNWSIVSQTIDLTTSFSGPELATHPNITFSEQVKAFSTATCANAPYSITVILYDANNNVLENWSTGTLYTTSNTVWQTIEHSFASYNGIPSYLEVFNSGGDCNNNSTVSEGAEVTAVSIAAVLPQNTTGNVTATQGTNTVKAYDDNTSCTQTGVVIATTTSGLGSTTVVSTLDNTVQTFHGYHYVPRHYEIEPTTQNSATVTLFVTQADFDAYNNAVTTEPLLPANPADAAISNLTITAFHGTPTGGYDPANYSGSTELIPNNAITSVWNADANRWELSFTISSFSGFFLGTTVTPLPIHMGELALSTRNNRHSLAFNTFTEAEGDRFEIERSADGKSFTSIQKLASTGKAGAHAFTDAATPAGTSYYRIKMISSNDNKPSYSNVVSGRATDGGAVEVVSTFPNPAKDVLNIRVNGGESTGTITLSDAAGKEVKRMDVAGATTQMSLNGIPAGFYFLNYRQDGLTQTIKVTVE